MLITFQKCNAYNKVFFFDVNKLAFYPPFIILLPTGLFSLLKAVAGMVHRNAYHSFFDRLSFWTF
jgi:hypothetical protein